MKSFFRLVAFGLLVIAVAGCSSTDVAVEDGGEATTADAGSSTSPGSGSGSTATPSGTPSGSSSGAAAQRVNPLGLQLSDLPPSALRPSMPGSTSPVPTNSGGTTSTGTISGADTEPTFKTIPFGAIEVTGGTTNRLVFTCEGGDYEFVRQSVSSVDNLAFREENTPSGQKFESFVIPNLQVASPPSGWQTVPAEAGLVLGQYRISNRTLTSASGGLPKNTRVVLVEMLSTPDYLGDILVSRGPANRSAYQAWVFRVRRDAPTDGTPNPPTLIEFNIARR